MRTLLRFKNWPLRAKMAALLVVASLLPLLIAAVVEIRDVRGRLLAGAADLLAARGDQIRGEMDAFHVDYIRSTARLARIPDVIDLCRRPSGGFGPREPAVGALLAVIPATDPAVRGVALLDAAGRVRVATEPSIVGRDLSFHRYVRTALAGSPVVSDIHVAESEHGPEPTIAYAAPVQGPERTVIGVVAVWVRAAAFWDLARRFNGLAGPGSFAVLLDRDGLRIAHTSSREALFRPTGALDPATLEALVAERRFGERTRQLLTDVRAAPELLARAHSDAPDPGVIHGFSVVSRQWNFAVGRRLATVPWTVFYVLPATSVDAQIASLTRRKAAFAAAIVLAALAGGMLFVTALSAPVRELDAATRSLAETGQAARVPEGEDEIGRLGRSFNAMADRIASQAEALRAERDQLEVRVQERTADLLASAAALADEERRMRDMEIKSVQLEAESRRMHEANRLKTEFLANMSHELHTPLNAIIGFAELLYDQRIGPLLPEQRESLADILTGAQHLLQLINDVLDLSKVEAGKMEFYPEPVQVPGLVLEVVEMLRGLATSRRIQVAAELDPRVEAAVVDPARLRQVLYNLLSNALKFNPEGGSVTIRTAPEGADAFRLEVEDSGIGIRPEDMELLFTAFQQIESGPAKRFEGTGLGLALTKRIVEEQGGRIGVSSEPGQGSVFFVVLPNAAA